MLKLFRLNMEKAALLKTVANAPSKKRSYKKWESVGPVEQNYDYFLVLDFEATCERDKKITPQEIIEFPCLKVNGKTFETESVFHQYVQPKVHKELTPFCTELTGIIQEMVENQPHFQETLQLFEKWAQDENLFQKDVNSTFVTSGDWDLKTMLPEQCSLLNISYPPYFTSWINIKKSFVERFGIWPQDLMAMLRHFDIPHAGKLHSGIDDCKNIASVLKNLARSGYEFHKTSQRAIKT